MYKLPGTLLSLCWLLLFGVGCSEPAASHDLDKPDPAPGEIQKIYIIVPQENPVTTVTKAELKKIYLATQSRWPNLVTIERYDYPPAQELFYEKILEMPMIDVNRYWTQQKIMGGYRPPAVAKRLRELLPLFQRESGAVAYVTTKNVPKYIKIIGEFEIGK